ncbi:rhamnogalacturonan endolyase [Marchantia polymorpha subsp. ruderalis]|uniref:rhamnogalacturonan endolyase n=1 Tax=Marchantia polymorpha TaxID=3197 RepID=A0A2R6XAH3_MARPO|nr:hypothetical protein MARPO_0026s0012 [Marchantia polymorpha]BBN02207.1 hypothetical protein Mp_2g13590 [Marchantia polymorpha subsp. ruderalis]|eukprot:PTQ43111.1 hypothetical protein MARPO_0026s0012 [Marchantia polymorpha]
MFRRCACFQCGKDSRASPERKMSSCAPPVTLSDHGNKVVLENGIVKVTISKPAGLVTCISYGGLDNCLESHKNENSRGYWDLNWSETDAKDIFNVPFGAEFKVVQSNDDIVELSFVKPFDADHQPPMAPLSIDKRFAMLRGSSGFYSYGIYDHCAGWRDFNLNQTRIVFMLRKDKFNYMALDDHKLRLMPSPDNMSDARSQQLAYKEARLLTDPIEPSLKGEVDDKYMYSCDNKDNKVHGWMSKHDMIGFWMITASNEFRNGGPLKQDLTSHTGPACLSMFHSAHYAGIDLCPQFRNGEAWRKVFGPVFIYLNSKPGGTNVRDLWEDAKHRMLQEEKAWPYAWPASADYPKAHERGRVSGRLLVHDKYAVPNKLRSATDASVGLALPGQKGCWQKESKGYQFWTQADKKGNFTIHNVRPGTYDLYAFVPGAIGDYIREGGPIVVNPGDDIQLGALNYEPPRYGPTVWEIGVPDRHSMGYIPDPDPKYVNQLFVKNEKFRNYGLWERYSELYPTEDLVYCVGTSDWTKDWYFAHCGRRDCNGEWKPTSWQIKFNLSHCDATQGCYKFRMAIATSNQAALQVKVNDPSSKAIFDTSGIGRDNTLARHGIHGNYMLFEIDIPAARLHTGENSIYLNQRRATGPFSVVMYDYLRLEAPPT